MEQHAEYATLLKGMDWHFEFADDWHTHQAGKAKLARLRELQPQVDPSGSQWIAASGTKHGVPQPTPELLSNVHPALAGAFVGLMGLKA